MPELDKSTHMALGCAATTRTSDRIHNAGRAHHCAAKEKKPWHFQPVTAKYGLEKAMDKVDELNLSTKLGNCNRDRST
eukprot:5904267-Amphidinium_carterae.1